MGATKEKLLRTLDILKSTDEKHPITVGKIIERLNEYGLEPERKSVLRDIKLLKDYGYDIEYAEDNREGFYLGEREFEDWELKVLIDALQGARFLNRDDSNTLADKLCSLASDDSSRTLKFMTIPANTKVGEKSVKNSIDTVMRAMRNHSKIQFNYVFTDDSGNAAPKHPEGIEPVSPYALIWRSDRYYLIGNHSQKTGISYYRLDRIRKMKELEGERAVPLQDVLGSDAENKLRRFVKQNIYNEKGKTILLRLALSPNARDAVFDNFGDDATIITAPDGSLEAYASVSDSEGLYECLMKHSKDFTVVEPAEVRERFVLRLKNVLERYGES